MKRSYLNAPRHPRPEPEEHLNWPQNEPEELPASRDTIETYGQRVAQREYDRFGRYFSPQHHGTIDYKHYALVVAARTVQRLNAEIEGLDPKQTWRSHVNVAPLPQAEASWIERVLLSLRRFATLAREVVER